MKKKQIIIVIIVAVVLIAGATWFYYKGKSKVTLQYLPGELPGNPGSGNANGASNDEIKSIANDLYTDMNGFNLMGHSYSPYYAANKLNDSDIVKLYNTFNTLYQKESAATLTQWLNSESFYDGTAPYLLTQRLLKLNSL